MIKTDETMLTEKQRRLAASLYAAGARVSDILEATGIQSTATLYRIVSEQGLTRDGRRGITIAVTLPEGLKPWIEAQDDLSESIAKLAYSQIEGRSQNPLIADSGVDSDYSRFEGNSAYSETEGKERLSDINANFPYSGNETIESTVVFSERNPSKSWVTNPPYSGSEALDNVPFAKMRVVFYKDAHPMLEKKIVSYVDEEITKGIVTAFAKNHEDELKDADEVGVFFGEQLLWLWTIDKLPYSRIEGLIV